MTAEASAVIRAADKVLYGTCEQLTERWIKDNAKAAESIDRFYTDGALRSHAYRDMIDKILNEVRSGQNVCLSLEGHPGMQVGCVGDLRYRRDGFANENLPVLIEVLEKFYDGAHEVLLYLAPLFVISAPKITRTTIRGLASHDLNLASLCVPPLREFT
jgi:hypothetical protein